MKKKIGKMRKVGFEECLYNIQREMKELDKDIWVITQRQNKINSYISKLLEESKR